jgi:hypothetical protein
LLGQDLRTVILPRIGPGIVAYFDVAPETLGQAGSRATAPAEERGIFEPVMVVSLGGEESPPRSPPIAAAVDNALRTVLAVTALDDKRASGQSRISTRTVAGVTITTLDPAIKFAYAVDHAQRRLVVSTSAAAVARYLESRDNSGSGDRFRRLRAMAFADANTYACIDLDAVNQVASTHRAGLLRILADRQNQPIDQVERDLAQVLALAKVFRAAFFATKLQADATVVRRGLGLIVRDQESH